MSPYELRRYHLRRSAQPLPLQEHRRNFITTNDWIIGPCLFNETNSLSHNLFLQLVTCVIWESNYRLQDHHEEFKSPWYGSVSVNNWVLSTNANYLDYRFVDYNLTAMFARSFGSAREQAKIWVVWRGNCFCSACACVLLPLLSFKFYKRGWGELEPIRK